MSEQQRPCDGGVVVGGWGYPPTCIAFAVPGGTSCAVHKDVAGARLRHQSWLYALNHTTSLADIDRGYNPQPIPWMDEPGWWERG